LVIGERFAWAHLPKTGGMATAELFRVFPELIVHGDFEEDNSKHTLFSEREEMVRGKTLAMNLRRLPFWVLSRAQHVSRWGVYPHYKPIPMANAAELAASDFPDDRLRLYADDGRFTIDRWIRMEHLVDDFLAFISEFTDVSQHRRDAVRAQPMVNAHDYDHDITSWFTADQIDQLYERNPKWAALERELYGSLYRPRMETGAHG
jgi:hypothetical protein